MIGDRTGASVVGLGADDDRLPAEVDAILAELKACRARAFDAAEAARRRIERNLHDGLQQRLVSIAMSLGLVDAKLPGDPEAAQLVAREARAAVAVALHELRELSDGANPPLLREHGLAAALHDLATRAGLPVDLDLSLGANTPEEVEAAAYFVASEALTNAAKHSKANTVHLMAGRDGELLVVEIADDGIGGLSAQRGSGLRGLGARVQALGGRLTISSPPGRGTSLRAEIPCA